DQLVSGPEGVARCYDTGRGLLPIDRSVSSRRTVRIDISGQASRGIYSRQYRGRAWTGEHGELCAITSSIAGFAQRIGNSPATGTTRRNSRCRRPGDDNESMREPGQNASCVDTIAAGQVNKMTFAIRHSLFAIRPAAGAAP